MRNDERSPHRRRWALAARWGAVAFVLVVAIGITGAEPAGAHADLVGSDPANGAVLDAPVDEIVVRFTAEVVPRESEISR